MPTETKSAELKLHREYDAPLDIVWDAWSDQEQIAQWWGPRGFTLTTESKDLRSGGTWKYVMHGPDGANYDNFTKYDVVEPRKKLVYDHGGTETSNPLFKVTVLFAEKNGKTQMDMTMLFPSPEVAEASAKFIKKAGGESTWDRLAEYVNAKVDGQNTFVINRSFNASIEKMFQLWTDADQLTKWACPAGFSMTYKRCEIKEGGSSFYEMSDDKGAVTMFGRCQYIEIRKPDRIVYTQQFCDEKENIIRHPMSPTWPENMLTVVQLTAETSERTRVTLTWKPAENCSKEEIETFINARSGMSQGWTGSFDKLDEYLGTPG